MSDQQVAGERPIEWADDPEPETTEMSSALAQGEPEPPAPDMPEATAGGIPPWALMPPGLKVPRGRTLVFLRFPSKWTDTPGKGFAVPGDPGLWRQCICWVISLGDKRLAYQRCQGDQLRVLDELAKSMVGAVDGHVVDWSGAPGASNIETWWSEVGERCRARLIAAYLKLHTLEQDEMKYFRELHRCAYGGLRVDEHGLTLELHEVDRRLASLGGSESQQAAVAQLGATIDLDPYSGVEQLENALVYLARYARQSDVGYWELQPVTRLNLWMRLVGDLIREENQASKTETNYT